jgi:hypothetical protein
MVFRPSGLPDHYSIGEHPIRVTGLRCTAHFSLPSATYAVEYHFQDDAVNSLSSGVRYVILDAKYARRGFVRWLQRDTVSNPGEQRMLKGYGKDGGRNRSSTRYGNGSLPFMPRGGTSHRHRRLSCCLAHRRLEPCSIGASSRRLKPHATDGQTRTGVAASPAVALPASSAVALPASPASARSRE